MKKFLITVIALLAAGQMGRAAEQKEWTLLVYINGHQNGLGYYGDVNIGDMQKVGSNDHLNIVVEQGSEDSAGTKRLYVGNGSSQTISTSAATDMGSSIELYSFIQWAVKNYPAKHYMIDVWNHGIGWHSYAQADDPSGKYTPGPDVDAIGIRDVSVDGFTNHYITTEQVGHVMAKFAQLIGHKVDVYGSDACMQGMVEIAAEMKDSVQYFVASQEEEPMHGWPYDTWLARWAPNAATATAEDVAKPLVDEYVKYYTTNPDPSGLGATFSAYNLDYLSDFSSAVNNLRSVLLSVSSAQKQAVLNAVSTADAYGYTDYKDFYGFFSAAQSAGLIADKSISDSVDQAFKKLVVASQSTGSHITSHGLSIWIPDQTNYNQFIERYKGLKFDQDTKWSDFISTVATKR